ncbi:MAG: hypothetical protein WCQ47_02135 [bacterium]
MKKVTYLMVLSLFLFCFSVSAESSKLTKVDLDVKTTHIVRADLGIDDMYYYIDTNACICWLSRVIGGSLALTTVDCNKLAVHPKLETHLAKCLGKVVEEVKKDETASKEEVRKEEVKKEKSKDKSKKDIKEVKEESDKVLEQIVDKKDTKETKEVL